MSILWALGGFFLILTPVVLIHEFGHFMAAKLSNIRVEEFGFGLPPRAVKLAERGGTVYSLNWIPLGGFVRPAGEDDPSVPGGFAAASKRARFFVLVAGAGANFIAALIIFWIALVIGPPAIEIASVYPDSPAMRAGLEAGDIILAAEGIREKITRLRVGPQINVWIIDSPLFVPETERRYEFLVDRPGWRRRPAAGPTGCLRHAPSPGPAARRARRRGGWR